MSSQNPRPLGRGQRIKKKTRKSLESREIKDAGASPASQANTSSQAPVAGSTNSMSTSGMGRKVQLHGHSYTLPSFDTTSTLIYNWPEPRAKFVTGKSILPLSEQHLQFKRQVDAGQRDSHRVPPPLDEWEMFAVDFTRGGGDCKANNGTFCIAASIFVARALHAYFTNRGWAEYERKELQAWSDEDELPKKIRLAIFDKLKVRLCKEIWIQPYPTNGALDSKISSPEAEGWGGSARSTAAYPAHAVRDDASLPFKRSHANGSVNEASALSTPAPEDSCASSPATGRITGFQHFDYGRQPLYDGEPEAPSMSRYFAVSQMDRYEDVARVERGETTAPILRDRIRNANMNGVYAASRPKDLPALETSYELNQMGMETSDKEEDDDTVKDT